MVFIIKNTTSDKTIKDIIENIKAEKTTKGLRKHFGALKRQIDGVEYQKEIRND